MKKSLCIIVFIALAANMFAQSPQKDKDYYLTRSKKQKSAAWGLLIGGTAAIGLGFAIGNSKNSSFSDAAGGALLGGLGFLAMVGSVPLFLASNKNRMRGSLVFRSGNIQTPTLTGSCKRIITAGIAITL
jgi:hypothetical protein